MRLFDFLRRLFFGGGPRPPSLPPRPRPTQSRAPAPQTNWPPQQPMPQPAPAQAPPRTWQPPKRVEVALNLDSAQFQPLSTEQVKAQAAGQTFTGFFEFGRQSRIPSAADPRTKLIDQAMVGQGLIAPEDLVKIHELGDRMDELRPEKAGVHVLAERAPTDRPRWTLKEVPRARQLLESIRDKK